ncbi:MAG TPA: SDR family NAD(P)-dependent oxidoreductase [Candidatus Elarobacter sp.]|jgi:NAD(P)-dependent dehydrogenase (short-subunit alcohol dehydrogenase family)
MSPGAIVVTGASTGIGADAAVTLAHRGYTVYAGVRSDADAARMEAAAPNVRALRLDVTDADSIAAAARCVEASGLALQGLVNNAGIAVAGPLELLPLDELRRPFEVNLFGAVAVTQAFLPALRAARGRLVFVGSISGRLATPFIAPYSASKFALRAVADALRVELRPFGIVVALIEPGSVKTPIWQKGRDDKVRLLELLGPAAPERYGAAIEAVFAATASEERTGMPVARVTAAIVDALTAPRPKPNYLLGASARAGSILALLPPALRDRAIRFSMRLP